MQQRLPHGVPGQVNIYVLDTESDITGYGKHNRLLVFMNRSARTIDIREDNIGLGWSTEMQRRHVACKTFQRMHPRNTDLVFQHYEESADGKQRWYSYTFVPKTNAARPSSLATLAWPCP